MGPTTYFFALLFLHAAFFTVSAGKKGPPIDNQHQPGGDIRYGPVSEPRDQYKIVEPSPSPPPKVWDVYRDVDGKFIIPYVFNDIASYGCVDENPFMCKKMKEFNMLDCYSNMESCCQTCKSNGGPAHFVIFG
ncbi:hypothetical protein Y032_0053g2405 [Ancylostoma ceylanicum]|uniref:ShKT domain-containing protein n=1 Tax=Ancylostoma ceylanicum TaxID=53326 RepID=A0A016U735_9BILA|nr:hypothetical protein Y032_0053g2405 [Ancylostoma ceylanicum]